ARILIKMKKGDRLPLLSGKEALILEMLAAAPDSYGLQLVEASDGRLKRGTVYVTLGRMEDKGYVSARPETPRPEAIGLPRRRYRATASAGGSWRPGAWSSGSSPGEARGEPPGAGRVAPSPGRPPVLGRHP